MILNWVAPILAGLGIGGAGSVSGARAAQARLDAQLRADLDCLARGIPLAPAPIPAPVGIVRRSGILGFLAGMVATGLACAVLAALVVITYGARTGATGADTIAQTVIAFLTVGAVTSVVPGMIVGVLGVAIAGRRGVTASHLAAQREVWEMRDRLRVGVAQGTLPPAAAMDAIYYAAPHLDPRLIPA